MKSQLSQLASPSQNQRKSSMEETLQRLSVGIFGWIATDTIQNVDLMLGVVSKAVLITLTVLSIYKLWRELK
jgi:hypothetical protein